MSDGAAGGRRSRLVRYVAARRHVICGLCLALTVSGAGRCRLLGWHARLSETVAESTSFPRAVLRHVRLHVVLDPRLPRLRRLSTARRPRQPFTP